MTDSINLKWSESMDHFIAKPSEILFDWLHDLNEQLPTGDVVVIYVDHDSSNYNNHCYIVQDSTGDFWLCSRDFGYNQSCFEIGVAVVDPMYLSEVFEYVNHDQFEYA